MEALPAVCIRVCVRVYDPETSTVGRVGLLRHRGEKKIALVRELTLFQILCLKLFQIIKQLHRFMLQMFELMTVHVIFSLDRGTETDTTADDGLTFRHRASCILGQAFHYSLENVFYIFNQQIYFII